MANPHKRSPKASYLEQKKIEELLSQNLLKHEQSGFWIYKKGWNDRRIANTVNEKLGPGSTKTIREALFGNVYRPNNSESAYKLSTMVNKVEELERKVDRMQECIDRLNKELGVDVSSMF